MSSANIRSVAIRQGDVRVRSRLFKETTTRPEEVRWGVFVGQYLNGKWKATEAEANAEADDIRKNTRPCICCKDLFLSQGFHNRMCDKCRLRDTGTL